MKSVHNWQDHKKQLLQDPQFVKALQETEVEYRIAREVIDQRIKHGYTQQQLAKKLHTKQSVISRVENAKTLPSLSFLKRLAQVFDSHLQISFG